MLAADTLLLVVPSPLLATLRYLAVLGASQREAVAMLVLDVHGDGYDVSLVFFGVYCLMLGSLARISSFLPNAIGALMALACAYYLLNSIADLAAPAFAQMLSSRLMGPTLIGEGALALWFLILGRGRRVESSVPLLDRAAA